MRAKRVLVVDSNKGCREELTSALAEAGYAVLTAADGEEAERVLRDEEFDLFVTDQHLDTTTGTALLTRLRAGRRDTAAIMVTADTSHHLVIHWFRAGGDDFFVKPLDVPYFLAAVEKCLYSVRHRL